jgi:hypothetical protein
LSKLAIEIIVREMICFGSIAKNKIAMRTSLLIFCCALWAALPAQDCAHAIALGELSTWHTEAMPLAASAAEGAPCRPGGLPAALSASVTK